MNLDEIQRNLGYYFDNKELLIEALTHSSCLNEADMGLGKSNEFLAWIGDAIIYWLVSEAFFDPKLSKEDLTDARKKCIKAKYQAVQARKLGLNIALLMPKGQEKQGGRSNQKNLHTVYEAIVGAIYIDQGYKEAKKFILGQISGNATAYVE